MLKFPSSLDEIDPLPDNLAHEWWFDGEIGLDTRASVRHTDEWQAQAAKEAGEDWKKIPGRPYWFRNGKGQLRYAPPLPPTPPKQTKPVPYSWVGKRLPKLGDWVKVEGWEDYYKVVRESANYIFLFDPKYGCASAYPKIRPLLDWQFDDDRR